VCNAINYTGADKKVYVSLKEKDGVVRFSVRDTGKGIKQEELDRIWDRYYRANQTKRSVAGSGIGLSIVQNVLIRHGMEFGVDSKVGEGSTFWFEAKISDGE
jgi:signal transduction histidine kinase